LLPEVINQLPQRLQDFIRQRHQAHDMAALQALTNAVAALRRQRFEERGNTGMIPIFSGEAEELEQFLDKFEVSSVAYGWTNEEKLHRFPIYLRDYAADIYRGIPDHQRVQYIDMVRTFRTLVTTADAPKLFGCQLRARKQYPGETANIF